MSDSAPDTEQGNAARVAALACLRYDGHDEPPRWGRAADLLAAQPDLLDADVAVAAVAGDADALRRHVDADRGCASRGVGPFGWPPVLYLVYSRMPQRDAVGSLRLLLDAGADPDSGYLWQGLVPPFTALTGVFGEGESGPGRQPRHPRWRELAVLLLERGADPDDGQALYNRMFGRDDSHLELLLEHGLGRRSSGVWAARLGLAAEATEEMMQRQLRWARDHGFDDRITLLARHGFALDASDSVGAQGDRPQIHRAATPAAVRTAVAAGADVNARHHGRTALHQAAFVDDVELVTALLAAGADPTAVDDEHGSTPLAWARWAHNPAAEALLRRVTPTP